MHCNTKHTSVDLFLGSLSPDPAAKGQHRWLGAGQGTETSGRQPPRSCTEGSESVLYRHSSTARSGTRGHFGGTSAAPSGKEPR